ncbi:MAG: tetratricopeptide repeat protein [Candidatus Latescibacterota bacterium]
MLKPRKRLTKRAVKEDKFVTFASHTTDFVQKNWRQMAWGVLAVAVIIVGGTAWVKTREARLHHAQEQLFEARVAQQEGRVDQAMERYAQVVSKYGRTEAGIEAASLLGALQCTAGKTDEALATYRKVLGRTGADPLRAFSAYAGVASCLEEQGKYEEAATQYRSYAREYPHAPFSPGALSDAARCFVQAARSEDAKAALQQIVADYPKSQEAMESRALLKML